MFIKKGWKYAFNFNSEYRSHSFWYANVRRRKWIRKRMFVPYERFIQIDSPLTCDFVNDIAVGGWSLGDNYPRGFLCVWIVSNSGRVFTSLILYPSNFSTKLNLKNRNKAVF